MILYLKFQAYEDLVTSWHWLMLGLRNDRLQAEDVGIGRYCKELSEFVLQVVFVVHGNIIEGSHH